MYLPHSALSQGKPSPEFVQRTVQATADAGGNATATFPAVALGRQWLVERLVVSTSTGSASKARCYVDSADPKNLIDGTNAGDFDVNDAHHPMRIAAQAALVVVWTGATVGAVCTARAQVVVVNDDQL